MMVINDKHETKKIIKKPRFSRDFWTLYLGAEEDVIREGEGLECHSLMCFHLKREGGRRKRRWFCSFESVMGKDQTFAYHPHVLSFMP